MSEFEPRNAVITGGASGIGLSLAKRLAAQGLKVIVGDLPGDRLDASGAIEGIAAKACDVSDYAQVEALADAAFDAFGEVHLVFNNAGRGGPQGRLWDIDPAQARAHFDVNFWGVWHGCRAFAPRLVAQECQSAIYNTGSENSWFCAMPFSAAYVSAKHGVLGLTENFREDLPDHVHAGTICPGWIDTPLGPPEFMKFGMPVEEFTEIILPQIMNRERFVVSHGHNEVRLDERLKDLRASFAKYAVPAEISAKQDVRLVLEAAGLSFDALLK